MDFNKSQNSAEITVGSSFDAYNSLEISIESINGCTTNTYLASREEVEELIKHLQQTLTKS